MVSTVELAYKDLRDKYQVFDMPITRVWVGGSELEVKHSRQKFVGALQVEMTAGYEASIATFIVYNVFDVDGFYFDFPSFEGQFQIGKSVSIHIGYGKILETVFSGYISGMRFVVEKGRPQYIEITAMDVKGQMMANRYAKQLKGTTYSACVKEILESKPYSDISNCELKISNTPDTALKQDGKDLRTIDMVEESDYEFVVKAAKRFGFEFFCDGSSLKFRPPKSNTKPLMSLKYGEGLLAASMSYSLTGMIESIEVRSSDTAKGEFFFDKQSLDGKYSTKGGETKQLISGSQKIYIDPTIDSKETATQRVEALMEDMRYRFGTLEAECIGIPDIKPGRFVEMHGLMAGLPAEFYLTSVTHVFSGNAGYICRLIGKAKTLP